MLSERSHSTPMFRVREKADLWLPVFGRTEGKGKVPADRYRVSFWDVAVSGDGCATPGALQASEACT